MEMEHAFDVERMVGDEEATTKRQKRQKRRYIGDSAFRLFTSDIYQADWANPFRFKSHLCCSTTSRHVSLSPMSGEGKNPHNPTHPHPVQADTGAEHARPLTYKGTPEQFMQRGARMPTWPDRGASSSSSWSGYAPTSGYPARTQYLPSKEKWRQKHTAKSMPTQRAPPFKGSVALEAPPDQ